MASFLFELGASLPSWCAALRLIAMSSVLSTLPTEARMAVVRPVIQPDVFKTLREPISVQ